MKGFIAGLAAVFLWAANAAAQTTVYTSGAMTTNDSGDNGFSIRTRFNPGASSAGGTLSVTFLNASPGAVFTSGTQVACITAGSGSTVYNCTSALFTLVCSGANSSGGNISLPATASATVTCTTASNFPAFTSSSVITVCVDVTSANAPYNGNAPALGTFLGYDFNSTGTSPCSNATPNRSDAGTTLRYYLGSVVSNPPSGGGVAHVRLLKGVGQ